MVSLSCVVIALTGICVVCCSPIIKPLNERKLSWQGWLLLDENEQKQSNSKQRKISPKSIFLAPKFMPEHLPDCADGYKSDHLGRCMKIIKLDEEMQFDFLLEKLNKKFDESVNTPTENTNNFEITNESNILLDKGGPYQIVIPLEDINSNGTLFKQIDTTYENDIVIFSKVYN